MGASELGTLAELPARYLKDLRAQHLVPLWPSMRALLPHDRPARAAQATHWSYERLRPLLLEAGKLAPMERAERRVLILANPGLGADSVIATPTIFIGLQLILPGETAPNHRHTPSAVRLVIEGEGAYTKVDGERCPMEKGDLILTPAMTWHEHGHEGKGPVVWLDALDVPLILKMESSYAVAGTPQALERDEASQTRYRRAGLLPYASVQRRQASRYPLLRYPWREVRSALQDLARATPAGQAVRLAYVNPETGEECLPLLGFSALLLRPGETLDLGRRSSSQVLHVVEGEGTAEVDGVAHRWREADCLALPTWASLRLENASATRPAFLFVVDDAPLHRYLGLYEESAAA